MAAVLKLKSNLDLAAAGPLWSELSKYRGDDVQIDASEVDRFGALCAQILLGAAAAWRASQRQFIINEPSPSFCDAAERMGLSQSLGVNGGEA